MVNCDPFPHHTRILLQAIRKLIVQLGDSFTRLYSSPLLVMAVDGVWLKSRPMPLTRTRRLRTHCGRPEGLSGLRFLLCHSTEEGL